MRHKFPVLTVKKLLKSVSIYGSYRKNKTGVPFFGTPCIITLNHLLHDDTMMQCQADLEPPIY